jgi:gas vesicle protein
MGENNSDRVLYFLAGAGIGAVFALLLAPKTGRETREILTKTAADGKEFITSKVAEGKQYVGDTGRKVTDDFGTFVDKSKEAVQRQKEQLSAAFEAGKAAYRDEKGIGTE